MIRKWLLAGIWLAFIAISCERPSPGYANVKVYSEPAGADVFIDDSSTTLKTDCTLKDILPGERGITLMLQGYEDWDTTILLEDGDVAKIHANLRKIDSTLGTIIISSVPQGADVFLDDSATGKKTDCTLHNVKLGNVTLRLELPGYFPYEKKIYIQTGATSGINAVLERDALAWKYKTGWIVNSSPAIASDGTVYVGSWDKSFYAFSKDGSLKWSYLTGSFVESSPAIGQDGTIYFGSHDDYVYALTALGSMKWRYGSSSEVTSSPAIAANGTIYCGARARREVTQEIVDYLYALNPDGSLKWRFEIGEESFKVTASPVIASSGNIYFGCEDKNLYCINTSGTKEWSFPAGGVINSSPAIAQDGTIYFGSDDKKLYALTSSGSLKWSYTTEGLVQCSPSLGTDGTIYVGSSDGYLYAITPQGTLKWRYKTASSVTSTPAVGADGALHFGSSDTYVYILDSQGQLLWRYKLEGAVKSSPALSPDGVLYVGSDDGYIYAINVDSKGLASSSWPKFHRNNSNTGRSQ